MIFTKNAIVVIASCKARLFDYLGVFLIPLLMRVLRVIIFSFAILIPALGFAQEEKERVLQSFQLGFTFSPNYSYRALYGAEEQREEIQTRDSIEIPRWATDVGIRVLYPIRKRWMFESGLVVSVQGEKSKKQKHYYTQLASDSSSFHSFQLTYSYNYGIVPIKGVYTVIDKRVKLFFTGGFQPAFLLSNKISEEIERGDESAVSVERNVLKAPKSFKLGGAVGFGVAYEVTDKVFVRCEPVFRYDFTPISNSPIKQHQWSVGANMGLFFQVL